MEVSKPNNCSVAENDHENGRRFSGRRCWSDRQLVVPAATPTGDNTMSFSQPFYRSQLKEYPSAMETLLLAYQSLGVVFGDLGTSPVNVFSATQLTDLGEEDLLGTLSLIFWALTILVLIKYTFIVIHADDHGEGGTFALYSQLCQHINIRSKLAVQSVKVEEPDGGGAVVYRGGGGHLRSKTKKFIENSPATQNFLTFIVLLGTCMVIGDGTLTPATCVISALQGIQSLSPKITQDHVVFMSAVLLIVLFAFQHCGTSKVSFAFSPIMLLWFVTNTSIGIYNIIKYYPSILRAISPHYMVKFFIRNHKTAWDLLGAVFLGITGAEAMFADLGHFNKRAIQLGFCFVVYPALVITYAGETAYLVKYPEKITNAYYSSIPEAVYWPMFGISTLAAIVASQSMISACFSIVKQSLSLECFPRVKIVHTSSKHEGQVYCPEINYTLMVLCVGLVVGFKGGVELANAYGVVVIWVMIITTFLTTLVMLLIWNTNILLILGFFLPYILIEGFFMTSLLRKIPQGGWVPFAISVILFAVMISWTYGSSKKKEYEAERKVTLTELDEMLSVSYMYRTPGTCFFFTDLVNGIPPIVRHYIQHTGSIQEIMVIVMVRTVPIKTVPPEERFSVQKLGVKGAYRCLVQFGYKDSQNVGGEECVTSMIARLQEVAESSGEKQKISSATQRGVIFVVGKTVLKANGQNGRFSRFTINYLYRFLLKNCRGAISTAEFPLDKTLQVGMLYEI
ncbi:PREDICTED: potassium transporter 26-like [Ipomoea nil]|uniref:potassium transporter 26-like n=1 Tax=Ipomoea nil TaxID=35883 RepID=UPI0009013555|nr:PREDICTED: potassium transporter 26-like [Ipomoea nil]